MRLRSLCMSLLFVSAAGLPGWAQRFRPPEFVSPEVTAERTIICRIHAPKAETVRLSIGDVPGSDRSVSVTKGDNGVWEASVGPVPAGAYRYTFNVDGLNVVDPRNPATSESNSSTSSLVIVPGSDLFDMKDVPHGTVAVVNYFSTTLNRFRRMHVYTPPGYERGDGKYPVLYLLHGAGDSDASWSTVGRAGIILDNLIATGKAKPMLVVMPAGHTGLFRFGPPGEGGNGFDRGLDEFVDDFSKEVRPFIESHYRTINDRAHRALAGLSMGGIQTLSIAAGNLTDYGYLGVFSSGILGIAGRFGGGPPNREWEAKHQAALDHADAKQGLRLVWFATGKDDFLLKTSQATVVMLKEHGFDVKYQETDGGHTWLNWRDYLSEFVPKLFTDL